VPSIGRGAGYINNIVRLQEEVGAAHGTGDDFRNKLRIRACLEEEHLAGWVLAQSSCRGTSG